MRASSAAAAIRASATIAVATVGTAPSAAPAAPALEVPEVVPRGIVVASAAALEARLGAAPVLREAASALLGAVMMMVMVASHVRPPFY